MSGLPRGRVIFDTGIYIRFFRKENYAWLGTDSQIFQRTIFTAVVAAELYAGSRSRKQKRALDELCRAHQALGNFSAPTARTWTETGLLLRRASERFRRMDFVRHFRDALIMLEAQRHGAMVVTENVKDFARWQALLGGKRIKIVKP